MGLITVELDEATCAAIRDNPSPSAPRYEDAVLARLYSYAVTQSKKKLAIKKISIGKKAAKATYEELPDEVHPFDLTVGTLTTAAKAAPAEMKVRLELVGPDNTGKRKAQAVPVESAKIIIDDGVMTLQFSLPREDKPAPLPRRGLSAEPPGTGGREAVPFNALPEGAEAPEDE